MGLFTKKCAWCGAELGNPRYVERMGKRFCSEEHAQSYLDATKARAAEDSDGCG